MAVAGRGGAEIREGPRWLECHGQVHGRARNRWVERHLGQCLLPRAGSLPGAGEEVAAGIPEGKRKTIAHLERAEGA